MGAVMSRVLVASSLLLLAAGGAVAETIGKAGAVQIDDAEVRSLVAALPEAARAAVVKDPAALEKLIRSELLARAVVADAKSTGFDRRQATIAAVARAENELLAQLWLSDKTQVPPDYPSEAEVLAAYEENKASLREPARFHLAQVFLAAPDGADAATLARALRKVADLAPKLAAADADFGKLARENSDQAESAAKGGDLGWLAEDQILPQIAATLRALKVGESSGPVKTSQGFHFLKLLDRQAGKPLTVAEARDRLRTALRERKAQILQRAYLDDLGARLALSVNQIALHNLQLNLQ